MGINKVAGRNKHWGSCVLVKKDGYKKINLNVSIGLVCVCAKQEILVHAMLSNGGFLVSTLV